MAYRNRGDGPPVHDGLHCSQFRVPDSVLCICRPKVPGPSEGPSKGSRVAKRCLGTRRGLGPRDRRTKGGGLCEKTGPRRPCAPRFWAGRPELGAAGGPTLPPPSPGPQRKAPPLDAPSVFGLRGTAWAARLYQLMCTRGGCRRSGGSGGGGLAQGLGIYLFAFGDAIGLSPLLIMTLCGPERVLVVSTEPLDDVSPSNASLLPTPPVPTLPRHNSTGAVGGGETDPDSLKYSTPASVR